VPGADDDEARFGGGLAWFPLVGLTVGGIAALARLAADPLGSAAACVAAVAAAPLVTGAFHEDGLADTFDALGPGDRDRRLAAMRDPRLGTFGVLALCLSVAARLALLIPLATRDAALALVAGHVLGRWSSVPLTAAPRARPDGAAARLPRAGAAQMGAATALALALAGPALALVAPWALAGVGVAAAVTAVTGVLWWRAFGGVTGDTCGATNQLVEIGVYAAVAAVA
jgi:adenosylcobinamide-GDP ribazoletransferase